MEIDKKGYLLGLERAFLGSHAKCEDVAYEYLEAVLDEIQEKFDSNTPTETKLILQSLIGTSIQNAAYNQNVVLNAFLRGIGASPEKHVLCHKFEPDGTMRFWVEEKGSEH